MDERTICDAERARRTTAAVEELREYLAARAADGEAGDADQTGEAGDADGREHRIREELVLANVVVAESIARRYRNRGMAMEELTQTAYLGLVKAANGFDPDAATDFLAYAVPTITGEVRRYFRDQGWAVRPPRRVQELRLAMVPIRSEIESRLGRSATVAELAREMGVDEEDVIEALAGEQGYRAVSLDAPVGSGDEPGGATLADGLSLVDAGFDRVEDVVSLKPLLERLPARERRILALRFFEELTQQQIGERVGVTQMQVSRLITRTLQRLREDLAEAS